ncbi:MAG: ABC transporter substrate-binding protein [Pseudonocardia sp.]
MTHSNRRLAFAIMVAALALTACGGTDTAAPIPPDQTGAAPAGYPVTIENCGRTLTFDAPPDRAVLSYHPVAETFVGLGLADRAVGRAGYEGALPEPAVLPEQAADFAKIPVVSETNYPPPREQMLALRPDFLLAYGDFDYGGPAGADGLATLDELETAGVQVYSVTCPDPTGNYAGETLESAYRSLLDLGTIFGVRDRAQQRVEQMQQQIADVQEKVAGRPPVEAIMYGGDEGPLNLSGGLGINTELLEAAGGVNAFDAEGLFFEASLEVVGAKSADAFVIFADTTTPAGELDASLQAEFLFRTFPDMPASQERRVAVTAYERTVPGWRIAQTVEDLARQLHPEAFGT